MSTNSLLEISLREYNGTRTHNHLVCKQRLKHLAKLAISFRHDFLVDTLHLGNSFPDLFCKISALWEKYI